MSVRNATLAEADLVGRIAAAGFYDDPVMTWLHPDPETRLGFLTKMFTGLVHDYLPDRGVVRINADASVAYWRAPSFDHGEIAAGDDDNEDVELPFPPDVMERIAILRESMSAQHPHDPHWYLNVVATEPRHQGEGLGAALIRGVTVGCDAEGMCAYLESSNPRNMTLYRRQGFVQTGEIELPDGPSLYPMWRDPAH